MADTRPPADRRAHLLALGDALHATAAGADWDALARHVNGLAPALRALVARGPWTGAERAALERLRGRHDAALGAVTAAAAVLGARLDAMHANKDGWLAYALHNETDSGASPQ
jgi:hypothetical protein